MNVGGLALELGEPGVLFTIADAQTPDAVHRLSTPTFEINGVERGDLAYQSSEFARELPRGGQEHVLYFTTSEVPLLRLDVHVRAYPASAFLRFKYTLWPDEHAAEPARLTKTNGQDNIRYFTVEKLERRTLYYMTQWQLSHFDPVAHSYMPCREEYDSDTLYDGQTFAGPIAGLSYDGGWLLAAYEHGADHPHSFLNFKLHMADTVDLELSASKCNYYDGQPVTADSPYTNVCIQLAIHTCCFRADK